MFKKGIYIALAILFSFSSCKKIKAKRKAKANKEYTMKEYPHGKDYKDLWIKVQEFESKGLPKSALEQVEEIQVQANTDKNVNQIIKTTIYVLKYNQQLEEESYVSAIANLDSLVLVSETPQQQIIHSVLAELYWSYYTSNRWKFNNRTTTVNFVKEDIRTYSLADIVTQVNSHYKASLTQWEKTREYSIESFNDILYQGTNTDSLRPTLYDFLAHRALDYFKNTEPDITKPAYYFKLEDEKLLGNSVEFSRLKIETKDTASLKFTALKIYQNLTDFHLNSTLNKSALVDLELERLDYVHKNLTISKKNEMYEKALENLASKYSEIHSFSEIKWKQAVFYNQQASNYKVALKGDAKNEVYKTYRKKAFEEANLGRDRFPESYGGVNCQNVMNSLTNKELNFVTDEAIIPNKETKRETYFPKFRKSLLQNSRT